MTLIPPSDQQLTLEQVKAQFDQWRLSRCKRGEIPEELWKAAASLYPTCSLNCIARTLSLNYTRLKHYVHRFSDPCLPAETNFIEMELVGPDASRSCMVEMRCGDRSMIVQDASSQDLVKLAQMFWSQP